MIFLLLFISSAFAADTSLGIGRQTNGEGRSFQANYRETVWDNAYLQFKAGYLDGLHAGAGGGLLVDLKPVELRGGLAAGPTVGKSLLEFNGEAYLGVRDRIGNGIGLQWDYLSKSVCGGDGRDYVTIQLTQRF